MKILALETSAVAASVAVCDDEALIAQSFQRTGLTHSATLMPMLESMLKNAGLTLRLDCCCCWPGIIHRVTDWCIRSERPCLAVGQALRKCFNAGSYGLANERDGGNRLCINGCPAAASL